MRKLLFHPLSLLAVPVVLCCAAEVAFKYPQTRKDTQTDVYHGVKVADPYRWLEDDNSAETAAWVAAQNKVTFAYFDQIPFRIPLRERLRRLIDYPKFGVPYHRGDLWFSTKNDGLQNQAVVYIQKGPDGPPEVFIDPNKLSADGTSILAALSVSRDGRYAAYGVSRGGSDWQEGHVMEVATRKVLPDRIQWIKNSGFAWASDGYFYSRYPAPETGHEMSAKNEFQAVWFHRPGTPQTEDTLIYEDKIHPQRFHNVRTTEDQRYAILTMSDRGIGKKGNAIFWRDLSLPGGKFTPISGEIGDDNYTVLDNIGSRFLVETDKGAPNRKVVLFDPADSSWKDVLPEKPEPLQAASSAGGKLFALYTKDVASHAYVYSPEGKFENEIALPGAGVAGGFSGLHEDKSVFYTFTSQNYPPTIFRYVIASRNSAAFRTPDIPGYNPANYESKEVFVTSKDGTRLPMFLVHKKGLKLDGTNPALLTGYGGFNITEVPNFSPLRLALLEQGFVFASANMRGGAEYGEQWHVAGTKLQKQNVFDDYIAAAEWLIANKYTSPEHFAANGTSNGGLLVGAVINQRPDLFRVAVPQAGVMDMLRFQKFTIGWNWIADYGSSDNPNEFPALRAYSPIHNVRPGGLYPAVLITTADHNDRVVPAHSFKYAATIQANADKSRPALIRIETNSGHGASSTSKQVEITADVYAFIMKNLSITPKF